MPSFGRSAACLAIVGVVALASCAPRSDARRDPNTIVNLIRADGATMNPLFAQTVQDGEVYAQLVFESLSYIGADYLPHPRLATSWTHSPDGKQWTVELRHGVRWSDGMPFTSKDVVFSYDAYLDPKTAAISYGDLHVIRRVTALGPYRVRFDLAFKSAEFTLVALGYEASILPEHILGKVPHERLRFTDFGEHPIGTGPYELSRWLHDSETVFVRNPYAWRPPHISRLDMRTIFNDQSELDALANGSADLIDDLSSTQYRQLQRMAPDVLMSTYPSVYIETISLNTLRAGLNDVIVRRAMMYGQDRDAVVRGFYANKVPRSEGLVAPGLAHWYDPHIRHYEYEPATARRMLDDAGWRAGPDGVRRRGKARLSFELLIPQGSATLTDITLAFAADMKAIGIDIELRQLDFPSIISRAFAGNFDMDLEGFGGSVDPDISQYVATDQIPPSGENTSRFSDPVLDRDLKAGVTELDDAKRRAIYDDMQREIADKVPVLYEYGRFAGMAHAARLKLDPKTTLQSPLLYYNVEDWTVAP